MKPKVIMLLGQNTRLIESDVPFSEYKMFSTRIEALEYGKMQLMNACSRATVENDPFLLPITRSIMQPTKIGKVMM